MRTPAAIMVVNPSSPAKAIRATMNIMKRRLFMNPNMRPKSVNFKVPAWL